MNNYSFNFLPKKLSLFKQYKIEIHTHEMNILKSLRQGLAQSKQYKADYEREQAKSSTASASTNPNWQAPTSSSTADSVSITSDTNKLDVQSEKTEGVQKPPRPPPPSSVPVSASDETDSTQPPPYEHIGPVLSSSAVRPQTSQLQQQPQVIIVPVQMATSPTVAAQSRPDPNTRSSRRPGRLAETIDALSGVIITAAQDYEERKTRNRMKNYQHRNQQNMHQCSHGSNCRTTCRECGE
jgi:hypothetical protein